MLAALKIIPSSLFPLSVGWDAFSNYLLFEVHENSYYCLKCMKISVNAMSILVNVWFGYSCLVCVLLAEMWFLDICFWSVFKFQIETFMACKYYCIPGCDSG